MRLISTAVTAALAMLWLGGATAQVQTQETAQAQQDRIPTPCALVCLPPTQLNADKCMCEEATPVKPPCAIVCPDPDTVADLKGCFCLTK
jgi:hypothetical protein